MLSASAPSWMVLVLLRGSPELPSPSTCEEVDRVELSQPSSNVAPEVCVSPGLMTGFLFDRPAVVELQDAVRFVEVIRGPRGVSLVPPADMTPGERIRLTAQIGQGESQQTISFTLVAHPGHATRQVEVYRDPRSRESLLREMAHERAKNQRLREQNQQLRARLAQSEGLRGLFLSGKLGVKGLAVRSSTPDPAEQHSDDALFIKRIITYSTQSNVGVQLWVANSGAESWSVEGASLESPTGEKLEGVRIGQVEPIPPQQIRQVFIEADAASGTPPGEVKLRLWSADARSLLLPKVTLP